MYKFLEQNVSWSAPTYELWEPKLLPAWLDELDEAKARWAVCADHLLEARKPVSVLFSATNKPVYLYGRAEHASVRRKAHTVEPFRYTAVTAEDVRPDAIVSVVHATSGQMNFLKDHYLAKGISHVSGQFNYLVLLNGHLVGGFILTRSKFGQHSSAYLLSDFSIVRENRMSKLVAMLATSKRVHDEVSRHLLQRITRVCTTAFTDKPVSMKYRGIFELTGRKPGHLNYESAIRNAEPQSIYREWYRKYAQAGQGAKPRERSQGSGGDQVATISTGASEHAAEARCGAEEGSTA